MPCWRNSVSRLQSQSQDNCLLKLDSAVLIVAEAMLIAGIALWIARWRGVPLHRCYPDGAEDHQGASHARYSASVRGLRYGVPETGLVFMGHRYAQVFEQHCVALVRADNAPSVGLPRTDDQAL